MASDQGRTVCKLFDQHGQKIAQVLMPSGVSVRVFKLFDEHGHKLAQLTMPEHSAPAVRIDTHKPGWDFSEENVTRFDGAIVHIFGQPLRLLKLLATASGPLKTEQLAAAWDDGIAEINTIRWTIYKLRKELVAAFPGLGDDYEPIPSGPNGYTLAIKD